MQHFNIVLIDAKTLIWQNIVQNIKFIKNNSEIGKKSDLRQENTIQCFITINKYDRLTTHSAVITRYTKFH